MNRLGTSSSSIDPASILADDMNLSSLNISPSASTFLPEEDSICPLLPNTPSLTPIGFSHPLTPSAADNDSNSSVNCEDTKAETSSSGSSSGIGMDVTDDATASTLFNTNAYQHLGKKDEVILQENGITQNGLLSIPITKDSPCFVTWNWPVIRKCTFFVFMSGLVGMCAIIVTMMASLPKTCNPRTSWYKGSVFYEIFPASFQDSNNDGLGDFRGIASRIEYFQDMGVAAIRLNSIFMSKHYPEHYQNISSLIEIDEVLGSKSDFKHLVNTLHEKNLSLVLDLPIHPLIKQLDFAERINATESNSTTSSSSMRHPMVTAENAVTDSIRHWLAQGVDGFYIKGLEHFSRDPNLCENIMEWKSVLGNDRILIVSYKLIDKLSPSASKKLLQYIDLIDVYLNISNGTESLHHQVEKAMSLIENQHEPVPWIQWSLGGESEQRLSTGLTPNTTLAATLMQLALPGSPSIFYGDEIHLQESYDPNGEHIETRHLHHLSAMAWNSTSQFTNRDSIPWLLKGATVSFENLIEIQRMIELRNFNPAVYRTAIVKDGKRFSNTNIKHDRNDILIVERRYPRRNTIVAVSNFGNRSVSMDLTAMFYSGNVLIGKTRSEKVYFSNFRIDPMETIVVRLDK